jgi:hypothetical protein
MEIRKFVDIVEETRMENGRPVNPFTTRAAAIAIIKNPFAGKYQENLEELIEIGDVLGEELSRRALRSLQIEPDKVESFGKGVLVGSCRSIVAVGRNEKYMLLAQRGRNTKTRRRSCDQRSRQDERANQGRFDVSHGELRATNGTKPIFLRKSQRPTGAGHTFPGGSSHLAAALPLRTEFEWEEEHFPTKVLLLQLGSGERLGYRKRRYLIVAKVAKTFGFPAWPKLRR